MYSTPGEYLQALKDQNLTWPLKYDDMFPYADQAEDFWTGYYTSRPNSKKQVRDAQANLHSSQKMMAHKMINQSEDASVFDEVVLRKEQMLDALGIYQHHDAVSGTAKQYVADDYNYKMF